MNLPASTPAPSTTTTTAPTPALTSLPRMRSTSGRSPAAAASLTASLTAPSVLWCWITLHALGRQALDATLARAAVNADDRDRGAGEALITAAITVGGLIIAGIVLAVLKTKATTIVNNVCTNADPSSC